MAGRGLRQRQADGTNADEEVVLSSPRRGIQSFQVEMRTPWVPAAACPREGGGGDDD